MNRYFYIDSEGKQKGTFTVDELRNEPIRKDTLVWTQGMSEWMRAADVVEVQPIFQATASGHPESGGPTQPEVPYQTAHQASVAQDKPAMPKSWMVESILVTILPFILCGNVLCLLGIVAIVNASKVESLYHQGLYAQANDASANAGRWTKITLWIAIGAIVLAVIGIILAVLFFGSLAGIGNALAI